MPLGKECFVPIPTPGSVLLQTLTWEEKVLPSHRITSFLTESQAGEAEH